MLLEGVAMGAEASLPVIPPAWRGAASLEGLLAEVSGPPFNYLEAWE